MVGASNSLGFLEKFLGKISSFFGVFVVLYQVKSDGILCGFLGLFLVIHLDGLRWSNSRKMSGRTLNLVQLC